MSFSGLPNVDVITLLIGIVLLNFLLIFGFLEFRQDRVRLFLLSGAIFVLSFLWIYPAIALIGFFSLFLLLPLLLLDFVFYGLLKTRYARKYRIFADLLFILCFPLTLGWVAMMRPQTMYFNSACLSVTFVIIAVPVYWPSRRSTRKAKESGLQPKTMRISLFSILLLSYVIPFLASAGRSAYCHWENQRIAAPVIEAVEAYREDNGVFPSYIHEIHPEYLQEFPETVCKSPVGVLLNYLSRDDPFLLDNCNGEFVSLSIRNGSSTLLNYDFLSKEFYLSDINAHRCGLIEGL